MQFAFDRVFGNESSNQQVFEGTTKDLVETVFNGYNCSVFAYGATGAGKTFTMLGAKDYPGITFLTMQEIYDKIETLEDKTCEIGISYLEVYNETVKDLLVPGGLLDIRESGNSTKIPGLSIHKPTGPDNILSLLSFGNGHRTQHATDANKESSRSHAVLQGFIKLKDKDAGLSTEVKVAKMSLIDLAGSEKGAVTGNKGARFREGSNINKSLLALGNCINALADGSKYIPYRNSKLTRLLKDSIGGNCRTVMIANVSPSSETFEDTFNTLKYADRAKKIKINLKKNLLNVDFHVKEYAKIVEDLRGEITVLKEKIQTLTAENEVLKESSRNRLPSDGQDGEVHSTSKEIVSSSEEQNHSEGRLAIKDQEIAVLRSQLQGYMERQKHYDELQSKIKEFERKAVKESPVPKEDLSEDAITEELDRMFASYEKVFNHLNSEVQQLADLKTRLQFKNQIEERSKHISLRSTDIDKSQIKTGKTLGGMKVKIERKEEEITRLSAEVLENKNQITSFALKVGGSHIQIAKLRLELLESKSESKIMFKMVEALGTKVEAMDDQMNTVSEMAKKKHLCLVGRDILSDAEKKDFESVVDNILEKKLTWATNLDNEENSGEYSSKYLEIVQSVLNRSICSMSKDEANKVESTSVEDVAVMPNVEVKVHSPVLPPTPNIRQFLTQESIADETVPKFFATPRVEVKELSHEVIPNTPNLSKPLMAPLSKPANVSFFKSPGSATPSKRLAEAELSPQSLTKKPKFMLSGWNAHRETSDIPATPRNEKLNETYEAETSVNVGESPLLGCRLLNDSLTIVNKLEKDLEIKSPTSDGFISKNLDSTFAVQSTQPSALNATVTVVKEPEVQEDSTDSNSTFVAPNQNFNNTIVIDSQITKDSTFAVTSEEPMDVDLTSYVLNLPRNVIPGNTVEIVKNETQVPVIDIKTSSDSVFGNISPISKTTEVVKNPQSLVRKTSMSVKASVLSSGQRRSPRNNPPSVKSTNNSTKKDVTVSIKKFSGLKPSTTPQMGKTPVRRKLSSSSSTSVLPKAGVSNQPGTSFKATIQRLNVDGGRKGNLGTERRGAKSMGNAPSVGGGRENAFTKVKLDTVGGKVGAGFRKLRRSVSGSAVLKSSNTQL